MPRELTHRRGEAGCRAPAAALLAAVAIFGCASFRATEGDRIAELLAIEPGMRVADVGAGNGDWALDLAARVGDAGHVFATEVDAEEIERIEREAADRGVENLTAVLGDQLSTGLEEGCCEAILLRLVYHHFTQPEPMRSSLWRALVPGGLIAVIDIIPQTGWPRLSGVPERGGHGVGVDEVVADMTAAGFELVERIDDWPGEGEDNYCLLFRRPPADYQATP